MASPKNKKKPTNYIDKKELYDETVICLEKGVMSNKLATMLTTLTARFAKSGNFANYSYNDDMQGYARMMLVKTWASFDPEKSNNAFAYYTQCVYNSFVQFLNQERRHRDIRDEMLIKEGKNPSHTYAIAHKEKELADRLFADDEEDYDAFQEEHKMLKKIPTEEEQDIIDF